MRKKHAVEGLIYRNLLKRLFFLCDPERVHTALVFIGQWSGRIPLARRLMALFFSDSSNVRYKNIDGITFKGPVGLAAGFDYNAQLPLILPSLGFGFATVGTVTYRPYEGNSKPRLGRMPASKALLVNKGFKSLGCHEVIRRLDNQRFAIPIGISIGSTNTEFNNLDEQISDIMKCFKAFETSRVKHRYYELNISCPNTKGGQPFTTPARLEKLLRALKRLHVSKPIYVKMPIDYPPKQTLALLRVLDKYPIAGVIFGNLTKDKNNPDVTEADRRVWQQRAGNLSGKPTWKRSNAMIALTKEQFGNRFTIIGTGGIFSPEDAAEKMRLGADLVQLITGMIYQGPQLIGEINDTLR